MTEHNTYNEFEKRFQLGEQVNSIRIRQVGNVEIAMSSGRVWISGEQYKPWEELKFFINDEKGNRLAEINVNYDRTFRIEEGEENERN